MMRWIESVAILIFTLLVGQSYIRLFQDHPILSAGAAFVAWPIGFYLADLLTGLIHWVCDSFGNAHTPVWGPFLVGPFRRHHKNPLEITQISLAENLGSSSIAGILALWMWPASPSEEGCFTGFLASHIWLFVVVFAVISNLFHRWSHLPPHKKPNWLLFLQKRRIVLRTKEHLTHHARPYRVNYCILCGWANPLTNRIPWPQIEAFLARLGVPTDFD